jgi:hypothetical protein
MKKPPIYLLFTLMAMACLLIPTTGCFKDGSSARLTRYTLHLPVYGSKAAVLAAINGNAGKKIDSVGKIYVSGSYIFISEPDKGIHVIDNSNPVSPRQIAFLSIPGNQEIAIKGNILYADMYADLLAIDISNLHQAKVTGKIEGFFSSRSIIDGYASSKAGEVILDWRTKDTMVIYRTGTNPGGPICPNCGVALYNAAAANSKNLAGSMAKMVLTNEHLFAITESHILGVININDPSSPTVGTKIQAGFDLETIYPFEDKLFLGSAAGVYIYDISNPAKPLQSGMFGHGRACDPVVADGKYAYVTLHAGTWCGGPSNELDVVNVEDLTHPALLKSYPMTSPKGLCKDGDLLFVCDGSEGVKVFNASDPSKLVLQQQVGSGQAYDVIAGDQRLLIVSDKGLYQYSYANPGNIRQVSLYPAGGK